MTHDIFFEEETHTYLVDGEEVPSVTTILNYMSDVEYKGINPSILEQASRRGTLVHEYTELVDYGALPNEIEYEVLPYIKAYQDFIRDYKPNWLLVEEPLYSEEYGYAGTVDRIGIINGVIVIVDIKTLASPTKMQKFTVSAQTSAYENMFVRNLMASWDNPFEEQGKIPHRGTNRFALYLGKDGEYNLVNLEEYDIKYGYDSWGMFLTCLETYKRVQKLKTLKPKERGMKN